MEKSTPTQQTVAHGPDHEHLSRKQKRQLLNKVGDLTMNADDMMKEYDAVEEQEEDAQWTTIKLGEKTGRKKFTTSSDTSHQNPPSLPSSIKVKHSSDSHVSSSVPGLSSYLDMSMTEISPDNQVTMVRKCVRKHMFSIWKFYHKEYHAHYSQDERTMCGFLLKNTNLRGNHDWWLEMQRVVIKTHTDVRNNAIKNMQTKFKEGCDKGTGGANRHTLYSGCEEETAYLLEMRKNICHYAQIIDTYAPCIITSARWNDDVNMEANCTTTDRRVWNKKILSISDEAFILLCLINYGKRWFAEVLKAEKKSKGTWTDSDETNLPTTLYTFSRNKGVHDNGGGSGWSLEGKRKYDELYKKVKGNRKQSPPTFNEELLKIFQLRRKKESGRGNGRMRDRLLEQNRKRAYRCIDEFNDSDTDDDDHNIVNNTDNLAGNLTNQSAASVVYNYSGNVYHNIKKESV